ncbi:hypothetical protein DXG01_004639 [Tephrocybe rancida]|nr:hypothetical protein DXG01_004639 [Tephrocybe rancida]
MTTEASPTSRGLEMVLIFPPRRGSDPSHPPMPPSQVLDLNLNLDPSAHLLRPQSGTYTNHHPDSPILCPPWFSLALELLSSKPTFGEEWGSLLQLWVKFESKAGYKNMQLPSRSRLWFLRQWFKNRWSSHYQPTMEQPVEAGMLVWWDLLPRDAVCSSGLNGILTLLFGLFIWREQILAEATMQGAVWVHVVCEVHSALEGI